MTIASAYTLEDVAKILDDAYSAFIDREERYSEIIENAFKHLEDVSNKYSDDSEINEYLVRFNNFNKKRSGLNRDNEKKELKTLISDLKQKIHWRKLGMSSGTNLPFKDFRSLRGSGGNRSL
jgi:hypothetical protein|tara:strand:+ start:793 stop:1158 length:366 start_codon:yes stop_codon:yes gene_type:complete